MRRIVWWFPLCLGMVACAEGYRGQDYPRVVDWREVEVLEAMPVGYRAIGNVWDGCTETRRSDDDLVDRLLKSSCSESEAVRGMKRKAARHGGELLVDLDCTHSETTTEELVQSDDGAEWVVRYEESWDCSADVGRAWHHDRLDA